MSQQTHMVWYTDSASVDLVRILQEAPRILGMKRADVLRTFRVIDGPNDDDWESEYENVGQDIAISKLPWLYRPGTALLADADLTEAGDKIERAIVEGIAEDIRGKHPPSRVLLFCGDHYFVDDADETDTVIRYTALVGFWGYSTPNNYKEMRRLVFQLPAVRELRSQLETIMGPLREAMYLSL